MVDELHNQSKQIDDIIAAYDDWRGDIASWLRQQILASDNTIVEQIKWITPSRPLGLPTWSHSNKMFCFVEIWKDNVKLIFMHGSSLDDKDQLFNARLKSSSVRAIELRQGDSIDGVALQRLVRQAIDHINKSSVNN